MGAYLSEPVTDKVSSDGCGKYIAYGASSMQGWRVTQEDAHNCIVDFDADTSFFAVYDGHGGHEVAAYAADHYPEVLKNSEKYKSGDLHEALIDTFLEFDEHLGSAAGLMNLEMVSRDKHSDNQDGSNSPESETADNVHILCQEALMPLEEIMAKYHNDPKFAHKIRTGTFEGIKPHAAPLSSSPSNGASSSGTISAAGSSSASTSHSSNVESKTEALESVTECVKNENTEHPMNVCMSELNKASGKCVSEGSGSVEHSESGEELVTLNGDKSSETPCENGDASPVEKIRAGGLLTHKKAEKSSCGILNNKQIHDCVKKLIPDDHSQRKALKEVYRHLLADPQDSDDDDDDDDEEDGDETFHTPETSSEEEVADDEDCEEVEEVQNEDDSSEDEDEDDDDDLTSSTMEIPGMDSGCTAVIALLKGRDLYVANAGDSRCVLCHNGTAIDMSIDHKPEDEEEMQRIVLAGGKVTPDGRVNGGLNLSRAFGDHAYKQNLTKSLEEQMIIAKPDVQTYVINPSVNDFMILACDGIWNYMSSQQVVDFVRARLHTEQLSTICEELFDHCLAPNTLGDGTGCDNMTAVIVKFLPAIRDALQTLPMSVCVQKATKRVQSDSSSEEDVKRMKTD